MKKLIKMVVMLAAVSALSVQAFAATPNPLFKPVKIPTIKITVPHYDFSYAVEQYLKEHPISVN